VIDAGADAERLAFNTCADAALADMASVRNPK
jgi:hypothetical protein